MKLLIFALFWFIFGIILGSLNEHEALKKKKHLLVIILKKGNVRDTIKVEVDTFKYYQP